MSEDGDDRSPIRPKRKIKRVMVLSSASSSDSEDSVGATQTRKKRLRVVSDEESSDSSGSSVVRAGSRRGKALPRVRSDSEGSACEQPVAPRAEGFASDSSEGNSDKCSICLLRFKDQEVGTPQSCEHIFCLDCITEWSKNVNTCPVDRISFESIVVRSRVGGRVIRTEPVVVATRRPSTGSSIDILELEDPTVCEICGGSNDEETMLLCDGCDLGYHMQCLSPPLTEVPIDHWFCPNCDDGSVSNLRDIEDMIYLSEVDDLLSLVDFDMPLGPRRVPLRESRSVRRSQRTQQPVELPSTSGGRTHATAPGTSRASCATTSTTTHRRRTTTQRRKRRRNTTKTVIIEYEVQENGKFPVTKRVKKKLKKRKPRGRRPRTAARRTHVRASVRSQLAALKRQEQAELSSASAGVQALAAMRSRAGIPSLSIFGNTDQLDYFSEEDIDTSEGATTAVAPVRRTSAIISAYRQARRKMISIPSPLQASAAPDLLSDILDSQTLLHSKKSVVSVSVDGQVNIKLQKTEPRIKKKDDDLLKNKDRVDLSKGEDTSKKAPSYPGQSGQGRGWGGGYQGSYPRDSTPQRPPNYDNYNNNYQNRQGNNYPQNNARRDDFDSYSNFQRRPHQYSPYDDNQYERNRRPNPSENNQNRNYNNNQRAEPVRHSLGPSWQPYGGGRQDAPQAPNRHSFGGFENPVDMRMGQVPPQSAANNISDSYRSVDSQNDKPASQSPSAFQPMSEPPSFKLDKIPEIEKSEDEKSDSGLVIDTEKYDPTEPTIDEDSGEEGKIVGNVEPKPEVEAIKQPEVPPPVVQNVLAGIDTTSLNVPPNVLDNAVRQVLQEHRNLIIPAVHNNDKSDDDSDGDCPNFSIYSATSVHIANTAAGSGLADMPRPVVHQTQHTDNLEDLVQEDDDAPMEQTLNAKEKTPEKFQPNSNISSSKTNSNNIIKQNVDQVYKERVSKRCPITTNTRNPIKIKLNTPSLIKRVSLYDEEDAEVGQETVEKSEPVPEVTEEKSEALRSPQTPLLDDNDCVSPTQDTQYQDNANDENQRDKQNVTLDLERKSTSPHVLSPSKIDEEEKNYEEDEDDKDLEKYKIDEPFDTEKGSDEENDVISDNELEVNLRKSQKEDHDHERNDDNIEKMTESISETEDERSYTPCLDENKSKDTSLDTDKDKGIEGLDTEMISEEEGNDIFSDNDLRASPTLPPLHDQVADIKKDKSVEKETKKKKKKESKKDGKEKKSRTRKNDVTFKKLSKSGKERNYRERDKDDKVKRRRDSSEGERERRKRKEKRKDLERYDVRNVVGDKRKSKKDPFGRDISPRRSPSPLSPRRRSASKQRTSATRARTSASRTRRSLSRPRRSLSRPRRSLSRPRRSLSRPRRSLSRPRRSSSRMRRSLSRSRRSLSRSRGSPLRPRRSLSRAKRSASRTRRSISRAKRSISRARRSISRAKRVKSRSISRPKRAASGARKSPTRARRSASPAIRRSASPAPVPARRRRRSADRVRKRRRSAEPKQKTSKKKKRESPRRKSPKRKKAKRRSSSPSPSAAPAARAWSAASLESRLLSPRTPPPPRRHKRAPPAPSKEVFTSGDNILVSVSFAEQPAPEPERRRRRRDKRPRPARAAAPATAAAKPVAIIDLERSPFRELTPSPKNVIVLSDSEHGEGPAEAEAAVAERGAVGPKTPPEPGAADAALAEGAAEQRAPSPDAYDPFEPTRSASASASPSPPPPADDAPPSPPRLAMTLEAAQKTNMSADEVLDRRPLSPIEKVMALLQSTRDVSPEPPPSVQGAPATGGVAPPGPPAAPGPPIVAQAPRVVLPETTRPLPPKLFLAKPSPIKSNPVKPMQATKISKLPLPPARRDACSDLGGDSPYSPGSSDFADLFEPRSTGGKRDNTFDSLFGAKPNKRKDKNSAGKVSVKLGKKKGNKTQVGVKIDDDNLKIMEELPSSAVEMQVKSKFLKKLNRQERVVEEVKLVLKPHYNKKHVTKDEYKDILRRAVPKICHNKTGEINPTKIQALVEAYVKKFRKKHKLGIA